jgi:hypothetical protein
MEVAGTNGTNCEGEDEMTDLESRLAEALRRAIPLLSRAHVGHFSERRIALQIAREALSEYDRAVIAETKPGPPEP